MDLLRLIKKNKPENQKKEDISSKVLNICSDVGDIEIFDTYTDNYDIRGIHRRIVKKMEYTIESELPGLYKDRARHEKVLGATKKKNINRFEYEDRLFEVNEKINDYENKITLNKYLNETAYYLNIYYETFDSKSNEDIERRIDAIEQYIKYAGKYARLEIRRLLPEYHLCDICGYDLYEVESNENYIICPGCSTVTAKFVEANDTIERPKDGFTNSSSSVRGEDPRNFKDALKRFQGKERVSTPDALFTDLDNYFVSKCKPKGEYFRELAPNANGGKTGTSKAMLYEALKSTGHSDFHENESYICKKYWGWELQDLSEYEDTILKYYQKFQECYENKKGDGRKSSLSTQVLLWLILYNLNIPCSAQDFKIVEVPDTVNYYNQVLTDCTRELGWKNIQL